MSFAKIVVEGTLISDPEKRFTPNNHAVTNFGLQIENPAFNKDHDGPFTVQVACWRALAEAVETQLRKGDAVVVDGRLMLNSFQSAEGVQKKSFEIEANSIEKLAGVSTPILVAAGERGSDNGGGAARPAAQPQQAAAPQQYQQQPQQQPQYQQPQQVQPGFSSEELLTEDDIPF